MQLRLAMDDAAADWYSYHFHDTLFLNDTAWVYWHVRLQQLLTEDQLQGRACALCGALLPVLEQNTSYLGSRFAKGARGHPKSFVASVLTQHIAGYTIRYCQQPCHMSFD